MQLKLMIGPICLSVKKGIVSGSIALPPGSPGPSISVSQHKQVNLFRLFLRLTVKMVLQMKYRVSIKELYTFKMIQETNAAHLELHTYTSQQKNTQSFVSNDLGDCCCCVPPLDAISF
jgi:hypothetical protein